MEFIDLKQQYERLKPRIHERINRVLEHGKFIMGPEVGELEKNLAAFVGVSIVSLAPTGPMRCC